MSKWLHKFTKRFIVASLLLTLAIVIILGYWLKWDWTGLKGKTLWDWLNLLGVFAIPAVVGFGTVWFTSQQGKVSNAENIDNQREAAIQAHIDDISELILNNHLHKFVKYDEQSKLFLVDGSHKHEECDMAGRMARVRTLTVLRRLDKTRKGKVLQFLYESGLVANDIPLVWLAGADLTNANLRDTILDDICLVGANLSGADLRNAYLGKALLFQADLSGADLSGAWLEGAEGIQKEQLDEVKSLKGAIMPDGSKHP